MKTEFIIVVSIAVGICGLILILSIVFARVRNKLNKIIAERFNKQDIIGATTRANFMGIQSKGGAQVRGNGALVLTFDTVFFIRAVPRKEYKIPIHTIRAVSTPGSFNGKSVTAPLLCLHYTVEDGEDSIAWAIKDPSKWKAAIEKRMT